MGPLDDILSSCVAWFAAIVIVAVVVGFLAGAAVWWAVT